ncbi:MAG TPA: polyketide synthase dehydratase domain-containing protein, partial [Polyangiaceae bacterium]|nr:polyketide synthase dehydratase domain-containing protein [Polyangiaceae bacterium]
VDDQDRPRYSGTVEMALAPEVTPALLEDAPRSVEGTLWSIDRAYSEVLFHRGPFALIRSLGIVADDSASAELGGLRTAGWPAADWTSDTALLDAGLQVAVLWGHHVLGGGPLPTSLGTFHLVQPGAADAVSRCVLRGRREGQRKVVLDIDYLTGAGDPIGFVRGLEMHLPPALERPARTNGAA